MRKIIFTAIAVFIILGIQFSDGSGITHHRKDVKAAGFVRKVHVVDIDLSNERVSLEVVTAEDGIGKTESFSGLIKRKKPAAAINANFFNSYSNMEPLGTLMKDGELVFMGNSGTTVAFTEDNKLCFDTPKTLVRGALDGQYENKYVIDRMIWNSWSAWYVNDVNINDRSVAIYTPARGGKISPQKGIAVIVRKGIVHSLVETPAEIQIPKDGFIIFYGAKSSEDYIKYVTDRFVPGRTVEYQYFVKNRAHMQNKDFSWEKYKYAINAGPRLLTNGRVVVDPKAEGFSDPRFTTNRGQRSALGITKKNKLLLVTVADVTVKELAEILKSLGAYQAVNLDGGASSALYCKGKILTTPGRKLSSVLMFYEK